MQAAENCAPVHGSMFSFMGIGCLLLGPGGSGKSRLMAEASMIGASMVADDQVALRRSNGLLWGAPPKELAGVFEMRGVGLCAMPADAVSQHALHVGVELGHALTRLPELGARQFLGIHLPMLYLPSPPETSALYLLAAVRAVHEGRILPTDWRPIA